MSDSVAPDSPLVTYPPDAARPGYNYRDYYLDSPDPIYVPVPGDEGFVDQMTDLEIAERSEFSSAAQSDISQIATPQFRLNGSLSSTSVPTLHPKGVISTLSGNSSVLSFASTTRATVVPPTRILNTGEVLPNERSTEYNYLRS
jgi:hypothetical protein